MHNILSEFKIPFSLMENLFLPINFHWQILRIQGKWISHTSCYVWNVTSLILSKFILFSTVKLKLGHSFSQFILRFKIGILNSSLRLYFKLFPNSQKNKNWNFFNVFSSWAFQFMKGMENWDFWISLIFIFCHIVEDSHSGLVWV